MPNIENLKKQAKQYLRWHRERYYPVAAQIRAALPRFRHIGDVQILESSFRLVGAQELVARQMGFDGWQALKSGADAMTDEPRQPTPRPILSSISAQLFVSSIKSSCDFYTNKLGFAAEFIYGDPPYYGQVIRDNARLALRLVFEPAFVGDVRKREHLLSASITVDTANEIAVTGEMDFEVSESGNDTLPLGNEISRDSIQSIRSTGGLHTWFSTNDLLLFLACSS